MSYKFEDKLKKVIVDCGDNIDINKINNNSDLVNEFNFDSINVIKLVVELESTFAIEIDDENLLLEKLSSYKNLVEILKDKLDEDNI